MSSTSVNRPIASSKVGVAEVVLYPASLDENLVQHVFVHLNCEGEQTTLVLIPSEARNLRDALDCLFSEVSGDEADG